MLPGMYLHTSCSKTTKSEHTEMKCITLTYKRNVSQFFGGKKHKNIWISVKNVTRLFFSQEVFGIHFFKIISKWTNIS